MSDHTLYLTTKWFQERGEFVAVLSFGQPQLGDENPVIVDVNAFKTKRECRAWFRRMKKERPWETRQ